MDANQPDDLVFDGDIHDSQFAYLFDGDDIPFWVGLAGEYGPHVLELACGTGRITLPIALSGVSIDGLDFSGSMLRIARERAAASNLAIRFFQRDIRQLDFESTYDLMFLPTGTFMHLLSRSDVEAFLAGVRRALKPTGVLAIDVHNPTETWLKEFPLPASPEPLAFQHRETKRQIRVTTQTEYRADVQVIVQHYHYVFPDGLEREATVRLKLCFPQELETLLTYNGFRVENRYGGYSREPFGARSLRQIVLVRSV